jgi:hypothetical protein
MKIEAGKKYRTREGMVAVVTCINAPGEWPIVGYIMDRGEAYCAAIWREDGRREPSTEMPHDLISEHREKKVGWVNIYATSHPQLLGSKEDADDMAEMGRIACIRIEYEDGEGL